MREFSNSSNALRTSCFDKLYPIQKKVVLDAEPQIRMRLAFGEKHNIFQTVQTKDIGGISIFRNIGAVDIITYLLYSLEKEVGVHALPAKIAELEKNMEEASGGDEQKKRNFLYTAYLMRFLETEKKDGTPSDRYIDRVEKLYNVIRNQKTIGYNDIEGPINKFLPERSQIAYDYLHQDEKNLDAYHTTLKEIVDTYGKPPVQKITDSTKTGLNDIMGQIPKKE